MQHMSKRKISKREIKREKNETRKEKKQSVAERHRCHRVVRGEPHELK